MSLQKKIGFSYSTVILRESLHCWNTWRAETSPTCFATDVVINI